MTLPRTNMETRRKAIEENLVHSLTSFMEVHAYAEPKTEPDKSLFAQAYALHKSLCLKQRMEQESDDVIESRR